MPKAGLLFSKKDEYYTPKYLIDFFGPFDYDPATTDELAEFFNIPFFDSIDSNGLSCDWSQYDYIWINPPFTKKFDFLSKAISTVSRGSSHIFFLLPIETLTTRKFHLIVGNTPFILWIPNHRIKFYDGSKLASSPAFGSVILEFSKDITVSEIKCWRGV